MNAGPRIAITVSVVIVVGVGGFIFGNYLGKNRGYSTGYQQAQDENKKAQEEAALQAAEQEAAVASASDVFQAPNPAANVQSDPLNETKKTLNPF